MIVTVNPDLTSHVVNDDQTLECFLPSYNPETLVPFGSEGEVRAFIDNSVAANPNYFQPYKSPEEREVERRGMVQSDIVAATQQRLDAFAQTRGYDSMLSACTYATSPTPRFAAEGQYCVVQRDATWARLYAMLAEVEAGTRPMPSNFADVETELPALVWPA